MTGFKSEYEIDIQKKRIEQCSRRLWAFPIAKIGRRVVYRIEQVDGYWVIDHQGMNEDILAFCIDTKQNAWMREYTNYDQLLEYFVEKEKANAKYPKLEVAFSLKDYASMADEYA